ncbi:hypothetical protein PGN35_004380 [Nodosilinea sp. PGN35]|uniref:hypothetical protein n=1 Tax=Nodosilinea sp. PGN35 TaxID=3020489 RepID=UPI0023B2196C|nr:hypothetical protein [Nodosilinea sp. TSF1-S3]MDF0365858.1 hypothetical protein [Nodosilinea sp. TSF1-S3]
MPQLTQGLIIAGLIGLLLAVIVGYYLRQGQVNELTEALQQSQKRQEDLENEHERRLRDATQQLQRDYEAQLGEKMEQYQARLEQQRSQLESEYRARQSVIGGAPVDADSTTEQRIRKQYETRLKEAATKIQQAYEQHLQEKLVEAQAQAQQDYDQRLAAAIAHYQDQSEVSQGQTPSEIPLGALVPEAAVAAGSGVPALAELEARLQAEYDQRLAQMAQDYEARLQAAQERATGPSALEPSSAELELNLRREIEASLEAEYEQKLAEKIEHYQDELTQRTQELEQAYEARLQLLQSTAPGEGLTPEVGAIAGERDFDLEGAIAAANETSWATDQETRLDMNEFSSAAAPSELEPMTELASTANPAAWESDIDAAALPESELDSPESNNLTWTADSTPAPTGLDASATAPAFDLTDDELALEVVSPPLEGDTADWSALLEGDTASSQGDDFNLDADFTADPSELAPPGPEAAFDAAGDEFSLEAASPESEAGDDFGFPPLAESEADRTPSGDFGDFGLENEFAAEPLDLDMPEPEPTAFAIDEGTPEPTSPALDEGDLGLAALLDSAADGDRGSDFDQVDNFNLDADFNTDSLDLDALLNAPEPEPAEADLLDDLDDLSNLS